MCFLFIKSDIKTILVPITSFGLVAAERLSVHTFSRALLWVLIYLLQFCVSNQSLSPEEDAENKPWRPIPAEMISVKQARLFRWCLLGLGLALSAYYRVLWPACILTVGIWVNNELRLDSHWATRNICNALGYAAFNAGATSAACLSYECILKPSTRLAHAGSSFIVLLTIHAQDFEDVIGDMKNGRSTLPILFPLGSRIIMLLGMIFTSIALSYFWSFNIFVAAGFISFGTWVGLRFMYLKDRKSDKRSYLYYNIWLALAQVLPFYTGRVPDLSRLPELFSESQRIFSFTVEALTRSFLQ
ncbi:UbiA prenyltransferase family [Cyathus striatus]|nr:UbiA prenyltransferase family [Cyathus striatus]